jgi:hypothetical protein
MYLLNELTCCLASQGFRRCIRVQTVECLTIEIEFRRCAKKSSILLQRTAFIVEVNHMMTHFLAFIHRSNNR